MVAKCEHHLSEGWSYKLIRTLDEVERIRPIWEKMQAEEPYPVINVDIDRYLSVLEASEGQSTPLIFLLKQNDQPKVMIVGRCEKHTIQIRIGYKTLFKPKFTSMTVIYGGILGQPDEQVCLLLLGELKRLLQMREVDIVFLNHLPIESPLFKAVRNRYSKLYTNLFLIQEPHWQTHLPDTPDNLYDGQHKKRKRYLHRYTRLLESNVGPVSMVCLKNPSEIDRIIKTAVSISEKTYKNGLGVGVKNDLITRSIISKDVLLGRFRAYILMVGDTPIAFEYGVFYHNVFFPEYIGYDPLFSKYSPGTILFLKVMESLILTSQVKTIDYGFGPADYKIRFGSNYWTEASLYLFSRRFHPLFINTLISINSGIQRLIILCFQKTQVLSWFKRIWRRKLKGIAEESEREA